MTKITSVSYEQLRLRRQQLKRQRQIRAWQGIWRSLLVSGIASTLTWLVSQSNWVIRQPGQITVKGNHFLSNDAILELLPYPYPQSLLQLEPRLLSQELESKSIIVEATVTRQLLPPSLTIEVTERKPVAVALAQPASKINQSQMSEVSFLDAQGVVIREINYQDINESIQLPRLKIIGASYQYQPYWSEFYKLVSKSSVEIWSVDWRNPSQIFLQTELGKVNLGAYSEQFSEQLTVLAQMRNLSTKVQASQIDYIDLTNIHSPTIQIKKRPEQ